MAMRVSLSPRLHPVSFGFFKFVPLGRSILTTPFPSEEAYGLVLYLAAMTWASRCGRRCPSRDVTVSRFADGHHVVLSKV